MAHEPAIDWLYECPDVIQQCETFQDYCDRRAETGDRKAEHYRSYNWLADIFRVLKRVPGIYVDRSLTYPDATQWSELFEEFTWFKSEPIYRTVPRRKTRSQNYSPPRQELTEWSKPTGGWIRIYLPRGKDRVPDRWGLYGKPTPMLAQYVQGMNLSSRHIELSAHDTYLLVILTTHVSAYIHLAVLPPQTIDELPPLVIPETGDAQEPFQD